MPNISTVAQIRELPDDTTVHAFRGTVKQIYKRSEGDNANGPWSFEKVVLVSDGQEQQVKLKDLPPFQFKKGDTILIEATHGEHGWKGVKTKDDEYQGKTTRLLWVTSAANMTLATGGAPAGAPAQQPAAQQQRTNAPANNAPANRQAVEAPAMKPEDALLQTRIFAGRRISARKVATRAMLKFKGEFDKLPPEDKHGIVFDGVAFWAAVTNLTMSIEAEGLAIRRGFADAMPPNYDLVTGQIVQKTKTAAPAAQPPPAPPAPPAPRICQKCLVHQLDEHDLCPVCDNDVPF